MWRWKMARWREYGPFISPWRFREDADRKNRGSRKQIEPHNQWNEMSQMKPINWDKPIRTKRDKWEAHRVYVENTSEKICKNLIVIKSPNGALSAWVSDNGSGGCDIENVPERKKLWLAILGSRVVDYNGCILWDRVCGFDTKKERDAWLDKIGHPTPIALKDIEFEEGEGLP